jgi:hypothetical protein
MGSHTEWTQGLMADINSMYQVRAEGNQIRLKENRTRVEENKLRKVTVSGALSNARALAEKLKREYQKTAVELRDSLGTYGRDIRKSAEIWKSRSNELTGGKGYAAVFNESKDKQEKKKGKHQ